MELSSPLICGAKHPVILQAHLLLPAQAKESMPIHTQPIVPKTLIPTNTLCSVLKPRPNHLLLSAPNVNISKHRILNNRPVRVNCSNGWSAAESDSDSSEIVKTRNVVEHICLLKAKENLSEEEEKDMLDYLYTLQYHMGGIVAISLGSIPDQNLDGYTHAVYMRFQRKEDLAKFYSNSSYLAVLKDRVLPFCHGLVCVDYECAVEDDILPIFRKGEEFNYGIEFMLFLSVVEGTLLSCIEDAFLALEKLTTEYPSLIAQATQGSNFNLSSSQYTHAAVIRFRSSEAYEMFVSSSSYREVWMSKFEPITEKSLAVHFPIEPVGTEIM